MSRLTALSTWTQSVSTHLPHLSRPQVTVLAACSLALVCTQSCGRTSAAVFLAVLWGCTEGTLRQRLREWTYEAAAKKGDHRTDLDVSTCFAPLLHWVLTFWPATDPRLALVLDATTLGDRLTVLMCAVVYRGCAIPIAWKVVRTTTKGAWKPYWLAVLTALDGVLPPSWTILVLADRGLYARWLFRGIVASGWHPYLRLHRQGLFHLPGQAHWRDLHRVVPTAGTQWTGPIICFKGTAGRLACTLLARWEADQTEPWIIVTDLAPEEADGAWYGMRTWIEAGCKDLKRGGWHWEQTKVTEPGRAERQWLVIAVATFWVVTVGGAEAPATNAVSGLDGLAQWPQPRSLRKRASSARLVSCFRRGVILIAAGLLTGHVLPVADFWPAPWPSARDRPPLQETQFASNLAPAATVA
jgi:hypothetical protein